MLAFFRTNQILASVLFLAYILLLWWPLFVWPQVYPVELPVRGWGLWGDAFAAWAASGPWWLHRLVAMVAYLLMATLLAVLSVTYRLELPGTLLAGAAFFLLVSGVPPMLSVHPVVVASFVLLLVLALVWESYQAWRADELIFFSGFWIAVGALFFSPFVWLALWAVWSFFVMRKFTFRELLVFVSGWVTPMWLLWVWYFWHDRQAAFWSEWPLARLWPMRGDAGAWQAEWPVLLLWALAVLVAVGNFGSLRLRRPMPEQKKLQVLYYLLLFLVAMAGGYLGAYDPFVLLLLAVPLSLLWGLIFSRMPSRLAQGVHWIAVWVVLALVLWPLL